MKLTRLTSIGLATAALAFLGNPSAALADGEAGPNPIYWVEVQGNTVLVCPTGGPTLRGCPDPSGMLRQDVTSKQVLRLSDYCAEPFALPTPLFGKTGHCYADECVPKGDYLYGFATPPECCVDCAHTDYYGVAHVTSELPADCARAAADAPPTAYSAAVPWPAYEAAAGIADVCDQPSAGNGTTSGGGGCGIHGRARMAVVGLHLFVAVAGLGLILRRRRAR